MNETELHVGHLRVAPGQKTAGIYEAPNTSHTMPVTLINGVKSGKTVLVTAGIHGGEYVGIEAAMELSRELSPENISGRLIIVHPVNTSGFKAIVPAVVPESGENLNRLFPGKPDGTLGERIAYALTMDFQAQADFYIDLHGGDLHEAMEPFVFYPGVAEPSVTDESRRVAAALDVRYMLKSGAVTGAYNSAAKRGLPSLLIERGGAGSWTRREVDAYKNDVLAALSVLSVLPPRAANAGIVRPKEVINPVYVAAQAEGCWYPTVSPNNTVKKGQLLGVVKDWFGNVLSEYFCERDAVILYTANSLFVKQGCELVAYAEIAE